MNGRPFLMLSLGLGALLLTACASDQDFLDEAPDSTALPISWVQPPNQAAVPANRMLEVRAGVQTTVGHQFLELVVTTSDGLRLPAAEIVDWDFSVSPPITVFRTFTWGLPEGRHDLRVDLFAHDELIDSTEQLVRITAPIEAPPALDPPADPPSDIPENLSGLTILAPADGAYLDADRTVTFQGIMPGISSNWDPCWFEWSYSHDGAPAVVFGSGYGDLGYFQAAIHDLPVGNIAVQFVAQDEWGNVFETGGGNTVVP